jgi:hypothetical protein
MWRFWKLPRPTGTTRCSFRKGGFSLKTNLNGKASRNVHDEEDYLIPRPGILLMLITVAALAHVEVFVFWVVSPHRPNLRPDVAEALIADRPEFSRYANLVQVSQTTRGVGSMKTCCYTADFSFHQDGRATIRFGRAEFRFYGNKWHLSSVRWGR